MNRLSVLLITLLLSAFTASAFACGTIQGREKNYRSTTDKAAKLNELLFVNCPEIRGQEMSEDDLEILSRWIRRALNDAMEWKEEDPEIATRIGNLAMITYFNYRDAILSSDETTHEVHEAISDYFAVSPGNIGFLLEEVEYTEKERNRFDPEKFEGQAAKLRARIDAVVNE